MPVQAKALPWTRLYWRWNKGIALSEIIEISSGQSICGIVPSLGGSLAFWSVNGQQMFRPMGAAPTPIYAASFPLVPYSNRIADGRFVLNGKEFHLLPHELAEPHALHGVGWQRKWLVQDRQPDSAVLVLEHEGDKDWPFAFTAFQHIRVGPDGLEISMEARNREEFSTPLGFGHHPYFEDIQAQLAFDAEYYFPATYDGLPIEKTPLTSATCFSEGREVRTCNFDNIFSHWSGQAKISWRDRAFGLQITSDLPHAVVYAPVDGDFFCFEPVPHINNALNRTDGDMPLIAPGDSFSAFIRFSAIRA